jgi:hypothetical protein
MVAYVPASQLTQAAVPIKKYFPGGHDEQLNDEDAPPNDGVTDPDTHKTQLTAPDKAWYMPTAQGLHDSKPTEEAYLPGEQEVHAAKSGRA